MASREHDFRNTPKDSKKYLASALGYIRELNATGKIIEASYYLEQVSALKPNNAKVIRLGYELAIKAFDNESIKKYDLALFDSKPRRSELLTYRLMLYLSNNNKTLCLECAKELLTHEVDDKAAHLIIDAIFKYRCADLTIQFLEFLSKKKRRVLGQADLLMKKVLLERLTNLLRRKLNA